MSTFPPPPFKARALCALLARPEGNSLQPAEPLQGELRDYPGLYASSNGGAKGNYADFDFFNYEPAPHSCDSRFARQVASAIKH